MPDFGAAGGTGVEDGGTGTTGGGAGSTDKPSTLGEAGGPIDAAGVWYPVGVTGAL